MFRFVTNVTFLSSAANSSIKSSSGIGLFQKFSDPFVYDYVESSETEVFVAIMRKTLEKKMLKLAVVMRKLH